MTDVGIHKGWSRVLASQLRDLLRVVVGADFRAEPDARA